MDPTYMAFDYGEARIGIAVGQSVTGNATPLAIVGWTQNEPDWRQIDAIIAEWQPTALIVGIPVHIDGKEQTMTRRARAFVDSLIQRYGLAVHEAEERLTSRDAATRIAASRATGSRRRTRKGDIDKMAAALILEDWLGQRT